MRYLNELVAAVQRTQADVGLATDGDADRIGAIDAQGNFIDPHHIFALALRHLVENKNQRGEVVKTVSTTLMIDSLCEQYDLKLHETPVGFNHIADLMMQRDILIGGANSGAFAQCQVTKVFRAVCLREPEDGADHAQIGNLVTSFGAHNYDLKPVFAETAAYCRGD